MPTTLRQALTEAKCSVPCKVKGRNTSGKGWPEFKEEGEVINNIDLWDAFTLQNLNESYGHVLDATIPEGELHVSDPGTAISIMEIKKPDDINHLIKWSDEVLCPTLGHARKQLRLVSGTALKCVVAHPKMQGKNVRHVSLRNSSGSGRVKADHLVEIDDYDQPTLVVGLGRPSSYFPVRELARGKHQSEEKMWPIRQLANLCKTANTRFGYILTDEDLLVCCLTPSGPNAVPNSKAWSAQIMPIPWTKAGETTLTTDLGLCWLCMLAMSGPEKRKLAWSGQMAAIDAWDPPHRYENERGWVQRHKYSKFERATDGPSPPDYQSPSPGNIDGQVAQFLAGAGINANIDFDPAVLDLAVDAVFDGSMEGSFNFNDNPGPN